MGLEGGGYRLIDLAQLLNRHDHAHRPGVGAPILFGDEQPHQLQLSQLMKNLRGEMLSGGPLVRIRSDLFFGEITTQVADHGLFLREFKIHGRLTPALSDIMPVVSRVFLASWLWPSGLSR